MAKCRNCGNTEIGLYKEIRQLINEMEISKDDIKVEITKTIDSLVRSALSEKISETVEEAIRKEIRNLFNYNTEARQNLNKVINQKLGEMIRDKIDVSVSVKEEQNNA